MDYFDYLNNKHLIELLSTSKGHKFNPDFIDKVKEYVKLYELVIQEYCEKVKLNIKNKKVTFFVHQDLELQLETIYLSASSEFDRQFLSDVIKVIAFK